MRSRTIIFYPKIVNPIQINEKTKLPFSFDYLIQCYFRLKNRRNHETLDGEKNANFYLILFMFLKFYKNSDFSLNSFDIKYELPFSDENEVDSNPDRTLQANKLLSLVFRNSFLPKEGNLMFNMPKYIVVPLDEENMQSLIEYIESNYKLEEFKSTKLDLQNSLITCKLLF